MPYSYNPHPNTPDRYTEAKVYKLFNPDCKDVYIGSTNYPYLSMRYWRHKRDSPLGETSSRFGDIFKTPNSIIELIEDYPCMNKEELRKRERYWIDATENTVNTRMPSVTQEERRSRARIEQKKWYWEKGGRQKRLKDYKKVEKKGNVIDTLNGNNIGLHQNTTSHSLT
jgi:hypothetical protein